MSQLKSSCSTRFKGVGVKDGLWGTSPLNRFLTLPTTATFRYERDTARVWGDEKRARIFGGSWHRNRHSTFGRHNLGYGQSASSNSGVSQLIMDSRPQVCAPLRRDLRVSTDTCALHRCFLGSEG